MVLNRSTPIDAPAKNTRSKSIEQRYINTYLTAYNVLSALGWSYILLVTLLHLASFSKGSSIKQQQTASSTVSRWLATLPFLRSSMPLRAQMESRIPKVLLPLITRASSAYSAVGPQTAFIQSFAVLEIVHVLLAWVRSPLQTTIIQVASRLFLVWGITEQHAAARNSPLYASMVISWALTEVIRYAFYAASLQKYESEALVWLRYTTFYVLYPTGAGSEAFLIYATLPSSSPVPGWKQWLRGMWSASDYLRAIMFIIWWPGLYIMYTHMMAQRKKVMGRGRQLGTLKKPKHL